jgi:PadR family transcriptional regulator PadR
MEAVLSSADPLGPGKFSIMVGAAGGLQGQNAGELLDILNYVRQIRPQDYYAPVVGEFELLVLLALVRLGNGAYGASIRREIRERTGRDAAVGTVYMTLGRLEDKEMIVSYTGLPTAQRGGRRRKHYLIHTAGQQAVGRAYRSVAALSEGIETELLRF